MDKAEQSAARAATTPDFIWWHDWHAAGHAVAGATEWCSQIAGHEPSPEQIRAAVGVGDGLAPSESTFPAYAALYAEWRGLDLGGGTFRDKGLTVWDATEESSEDWALVGATLHDHADEAAEIVKGWQADLDAAWPDVVRAAKWLASQRASARS